MPKVTKIGNSYHISINADLREMLQLKEGDRVCSSFQIIDKEHYIVTKKIEKKS
jgi:antitoxin component of MazEF toxin-antitoxin module